MVRAHGAKGELPGCPLKRATGLPRRYDPNLSFRQTRPGAARRATAPRPACPRLQMVLHGADRRQPAGRRGTEGDLPAHGEGHGADDLVLHGEEVGELAVISFGPDVGAGKRIDQLDRDPQAVALLLLAAFEDVMNAQLLRDGPDVCRLVPIFEAGVPGDDEELREARRLGDDPFADGVAQIPASSAALLSFSASTAIEGFCGRTCVSAVLGGLRVDHLAPMRLEPFERPGLVLAHGAAVADDVIVEDREGGVPSETSPCRNPTPEGR